MQRLSRQDKAILEALEIYESAADVAAETGASWHRIIHLQRLYGSVRCQASRQWDDRQTSKLAAKIKSELYSPNGPHPLTAKLSSPFGDYWRRLEGLDEEPDGRGRGAA